jgi:glycerol-3-phosphate acyltransferase PlsY
MKDMSTVVSVLPVACGYLIGSIPFAWLLARRLRGVDIRLTGSGNVGAANAYRATGPAAAALIVALDLAKGASAVLIANRAGLGAAVQAASGVAAVVGHVFPVWLGFRGGKGVATACGVFAVLAPFATALAGLVFVVTVWGTRYVSLGSLGAAVVLPPLAYYLAAPVAVVVAAVACTMMIVERHRPNLARLLRGTEPRLSHKT